MKKLDFSLILPCYNEVEHFKESSLVILNTLIKSKLKFEIIFVEDKSSDSTYELVSEFVNRQNSYYIRAIYHRQNEGRGKSVTDGIKISRGKYVGFIDIDCEVSPAYIPEFIKKLNNGFDVVCGKRLYRTGPFGILRAVASKLYSRLVNIFLSTSLSDTEAGYKFFRKDKILSILSQVKDRGWFWDTEVMIRAERAGLKIAFISVRFNRRVDKTSTVNLWRDTIDYLFKLIQFRRKVKEENGKKTDIDLYWQKNSPAFSNHYNTVLGLPLTPTSLFLTVRHRKIINILKKLTGDVVLDVGCGSGVFMIEALKLGKTAIGIDYSSQMIALAKQNLAPFSKLRYRLYQGDATKFPLNTGSVDIVIASGLTDYLSFDKVQKFLKESARVLKKGGYAIITFPKKDSPLSFLRQGWGLMLRKIFLKLPPIESVYTREQIISFCTNVHIQSREWDEVLGTMRIMIGKRQ